jgi:hypothetical protein
MKFSTAITLSLIASASAFAPSPAHKASTALNLNNDQSRRAVLASITTGVIASTLPSPASALIVGSYKPKYDDMKQIYGLGVTLDNLKKKVADPDQSEAALVGLRAFNKDSKFYTGYALNFIGKTVKNNAEGDDRVGYIRQASAIIGSIQELLEGRQGLVGEEAAKEATARVEKAQALIGKFLAECEVEDEKFGPFIQAHPY